MKTLRYYFWVFVLFTFAMCVVADERGFFRVRSSGDTRITSFKSDGTIAWSNAVVGSTGKIQRAASLPASEDSWLDAHVFTTTTEVMTASLVLEVPSGMVLIPGGTNAGTDPDFGAYSLTVTSFYMDKYEVTKALWDEVYVWAIANGYSFTNAGRGKATNHPVQAVNSYDVVKWCNARSQMEGRQPVYTVNGAVYKAGQTNDIVQTSVAGYRLPTSDEWEYAARGGAASRRFAWSDSDEIQHARANYYSRTNEVYDTSLTRGFHPDSGPSPNTMPVGVFAANGYGLHDMTGNVSEWCIVWNPGYEVYIRGGYWYAYAYECPIGYRGDPSYPGNSSVYKGFRTVLSPGQP